MIETNISLKQIIKIGFLGGLSLGFFAWPVIALASVEQFVLVNPPASGAIDEAIHLTIQSQDGSGGSTPITETFDLFVSTDSATGSFSSNKDNWQAVEKLTMSRNSANRNLYYRDATARSVNLTILAKGRDSGDEWTVNHTVNIGGVGGDNSNTGTSTATQTSTNTASGGSSSAHSSYASLSNNEIIQKFAISLGRDRLVSVLSPVEFEAIVLANTLSRDGAYSWSFGDGGSERGRSVTHTYQLPGIYQVVVNGESGGVKAVARAKVKVVVPEVSIGEVALDKIELKNNGADEVNLGDWALSFGNNRFVIPDDTLLAPKMSVWLSATTTGLFLNTANTLTLKDQAKKVATERVVTMAPQPATNHLALAEAQLKLARLQTELAKLRQPNQPAVNLVNREPLQGLISESNNRAGGDTEELSSQLASTIILEKEKGVFGWFNELPNRGLTLVKSLFSR